jgi:hypothetical protein
MRAWLIASSFNYNDDGDQASRGIAVDPEAVCVCLKGLIMRIAIGIAVAFVVAVLLTRILGFPEQKFARVEHRREGWQPKVWASRGWPPRSFSAPTSHVFCSESKLEIPQALKAGCNQIGGWPYQVSVPSIQSRVRTDIPSSFATRGRRSFVPNGAMPVYAARPSGLGAQ